MTQKRNTQHQLWQQGMEPGVPNLLSKGGKNTGRYGGHGTEGPIPARQ